MVFPVYTGPRADVCAVGGCAAHVYPSEVQSYTDANGDAETYPLCRVHLRERDSDDRKAALLCTQPATGWAAFARDWLAERNVQMRATPPAIGSRWTHPEHGTQVVRAIWPEYIGFSEESESAAGWAWRRGDWPGEWREVPAARGNIVGVAMNDAAKGEPVRIYCSTAGVPTFSRAMANMRVAFYHLAQAMETPQGRRVLAVQAVANAGDKLPSQWNREAYRAACLARIEAGDSTDWLHYGQVIWPSNRFREAYQTALAALRSPPLTGRPARWSGGRR